MSPAAPSDTAKKEETLLPRSAITKSEPTTEASTIQVRTFAGLGRWSWGEDLSNNFSLTEVGWIPDARIEFVDGNGRWDTLGVGFDFANGAIDYHGYQQDFSTLNLQPYDTRTHYRIVGLDASFSHTIAQPFGSLVFSASLGATRWYRSIDATSFETPGPAGYVETWTLVKCTPAIGFVLPVDPEYSLQLRGGMVIPLSCKSHIDHSSQGDLDLAPKANVSPTMSATLAAGRLLISVEYLAMDFAESAHVLKSITVDGDSRIGEFFQPDSHLRRLQLRLGCIW